MISIVLAIDPGVQGAFAWVSGDGYLIEVDDMPIIEVRGKRKINTAMVRELMTTRAVGMIVIEGVSPHFRQGGAQAGMFNFGYGAGLLEGVAVGLSLPVQIIPAASWKRQAMVPADKGAARQMASRLWPGAADRFKRVKDDGRAESALLARWVAMRNTSSAIAA